MEVTADMGTDKPTFEPDLVDLTGISLERIALLPESVLTTALLRILRTPADNSDDAERYASFQNII